MKKIGKYEIQGEIGRGGMGVVYKAYDPYLEEIVAVKMMSSEYSSDEGFRKKFFEEGKKTRRLKHENIIEVLDLDEDEGLEILHFAKSGQVLVRTHVLKYVEYSNVPRGMSGDLKLNKLIPWGFERGKQIQFP